MSKKFKYAVIAVVVVSFMFFGIYSTLAARSGYVAKVDGIKITVQEFNQYASNRKQQIFANVKGDHIRQKQAVEFVQSKQFEEFVLNEMTNMLVISKFLKDSNMEVSPEVMAGFVRNMATFQKNDKFDVEYFKQYLKYIGLSEYDFLEQQIPEVEQNLFGQLMSAMQLGSGSKLAEEYAKALKRERDIEVLTVRTPEVKKPSDDELQKFYQESKQHFVEKPQHYVVVSYIDDYIKHNKDVFQATPAMIENYYNDSYLGKVIKIYYVEFTSEEKAGIAHSIVSKQGLSLQSITETMQKKPINNIASAGLISSSDVDDVEVISAIRNLKIGNITPIINRGDKFYIAQVLDIKEDRFLNRESYETINDEILHKRKCNNVQVYTDKIRQEFESGLSFESVALKYGLPISARIVVDENDGTVRNEQGKVIDANTKLVEHVLANNDTSYGYVLNVSEEDCSFAVYKQERIAQERIKTLPEVRGEVIAMYEAKKAQEEKSKIAKSIVDQVTSRKGSLFDYKTHGDVRKDSVLLGSNIGSDVFAKSVGETFITSDGKNLFVVRITNERQYDGKVLDDEVIKVSSALQNDYYNSFLREFVNRLYQEYNVKRLI